MIAAHVARNFSALTDIPDANKPVIVKLAHERCVWNMALSFKGTELAFSDKSIGVLVKHIVNFLLPTPEDDDDDAPSPSSLALVAVEDVIKSCMSRRNYGLDTISGVKPPSVICVWRWEVNADLTHYLPTNSREKADRRRDERVNVCLPAALTPASLTCFLLGQECTALKFYDALMSRAGNTLCNSKWRSQDQAIEQYIFYD